MYRQSRRADDNGENSSEWEKIQGGIPLDEMYIFNTQEKIDPRSTDRFLLSHGQELLSKLRVKTEAFAWTVFGTVCVDPLWDDSEDLVYIARGKVIKRKGAGNGPMQQNTCLSTTIYRRWSLVPLQRQERFLCADFSNGLQTVNTNWNSLWKRWLPDFSWRPVRGGLCGNEEFEKAQAKIQHGTYHIGAGSPWIEMLVEGEVVRINTGRRAASASASSSGSSWPRSSTSRSGKVGNCATPCKQARRVLTSSTRFGRRPTPTARQDPPAGKTQMESVKWSLAIGVAGFGHENSRRRL